jgi:hypothetical protein
MWRATYTSAGMYAAQFCQPRPGRGGWSDGYRGRGMRARVALTALAAVTASGCGHPPPGAGPARHAPIVSATTPGYPALATQNTTRIAADDPVAIAAAVARIVFPGAGPAARPNAVVLVDRSDWRAGIAASVLSAPPLHAPILLTDGRHIPPATQAALSALRPTGAHVPGGAQVIRIGSAPAPAGLRSTRIATRDRRALDGAIASFAIAARGTPARAVMIASADRPGYAMPTAALAAQSGVPVLLTRQNALSTETRAAIAALNDPRIYIVGPPVAINGQVRAALQSLGTVVRIAGRNPSGNSVAFARFVDPQFGWGVGQPGHGLVFASATADPQLAAATAALSTSGSYGPLVLLGDPQLLDAPTQGYLADIEPHTAGDPAHGVYNHAWIVGAETAISVTLQAQIDRLLEITPVP